MYIIVDHRDSFTYNLAQLFGAQGVELQVRDAGPATLQALVDQPPQALVLSPGPGHPAAATETMELVRRLTGRVPLLGVCLGHQILCAALGARVERAARPMHGQGDRIRVRRLGLFEAVPGQLEVARYHSLVVSRDGLPSSLRVAAWDACGQIMAVQHRRHPSFGLQFHPESFLSSHGPALAAAFVQQVNAFHARGPLLQRCCG